MAKGKRRSWYYGLSWLVRVIIAIIPILSLIIHLLARIDSSKSLLNTVLIILIMIIFGWNIVYIVDIITTIVIRKILLT